MRAPFFATLFLLFAGLGLHAQFRISGRVLNKQKNPVQYAEVAIMGHDSVKAAVGNTDENGHFDLQARSGNFTLLVSQLGKQLRRMPIEVKEDVALGDIIIDEAEFLDEVSITKSKRIIERKIDRVVFNVENAIMSSGGDATDLLSITPSIRLQSNSITMIGKSGLGVMVDDKLVPLSGDDLMNYLKTIPSENIRSIEVISNPPAQYSAEGNSGLVNIRLKKPKHDNWNVGINQSIKVNHYLTLSGNTSFTYQKKALSLYANLNYYGGKNKGTEYNTIYYPDEKWQGNNNRIDKNKSLGGRFGIDYKFSKSFTLGAQFMGNTGKPTATENNIVNIIDEGTQALNAKIVTLGDNDRKNTTASYNIHGTVAFDTIGNKMNFDLDLLRYTSQDNRNVASARTDAGGVPDAAADFAFRNNSDSNFRNYSAKIDFETAPRKYTFYYGARFSGSKNRSALDFYNLQSGVEVPDPTQSNRFDFTENIAAGYISMSGKLGKKWELQAGCRVESTDTKGYSQTLDDTHTNHYLEVFPTLYLLYTANEKNTLSFNLGRRINRPAYFTMNPFRWYRNAYYYTEGNPFLKPSITYNAESTYAHGQNLESKIYLSVLTDGISVLGKVDAGTRISANTYDNFYKTTIVGFSQSFSYTKKKWWESYNSVDLSVSNSTSTQSVTNPSRHGFNSNISSYNNFTFNKSKTFTGSANVWITPKGVTDLDRMSTAGQLDLALRYQMLERKLQFSLIGNDVLRTNRATYISYSNDIKVRNKNYYDNRFVRLSISYKFGNKNVQSQQRDFGNEGEKGRIAQ